MDLDNEDIGTWFDEEEDENESDLENDLIGDIVYFTK